MKLVMLDFESQSLADLRKCGGRRYWEHPSTRALCCAWHEPATGDSGVWVHGEPQPPVTVDAACVAHNASGFDRFGADRLGWRTGPWVDSSHLARALGYGGSLDALGGDKDKAAARYTTSLSTPKRGGIPADAWRHLSAAQKRERGTLLALDRIDWHRVVAYCESDVDILARAWPELRAALAIEPDVEAASWACNDRGVAFDAPLAKALLDCVGHNVGVAVESAAAMLRVSYERARAIASSPAQYCGFARSDDAQAATVDAHLLSDNLELRALANARKAIASIAKGKLEAGLARVSPDGRLRDSHQYYGAHTGRWSGRGMQLQNMPRTASWSRDDIARLCDRVLAGYRASPAEIDVCLRACLHARPGHTLLVVDYSSVEARGLAWIASDQEALDVFRAGRDPYRAVAAKMFGARYEDIPKSDPRRQLGKVVELACGYGMGAEKFARTTGADPKLVAMWRAVRPRVTNLWRDLEDQWVEGGRIGHFLRFDRDGANLRMTLPSGRPLYYRDVPAVEAKGARFNALEYRGVRFAERTYGGKLAENATQALCRDLLADALVRAERAGLAPVLHVHDEIVCEVPAGTPLVELKRVMLAGPAWAEGLPLAVEGYAEERYRK